MTFTVKQPNSSQSSSKSNEAKKVVEYYLNFGLTMEDNKEEHVQINFNKYNSGGIPIDPEELKAINYGDSDKAELSQALVDALLEACSTLEPGQTKQINELLFIRRRGEKEEAVVSSEVATGVKSLFGL